MRKRTDPGRLARLEIVAAGATLDAHGVVLPGEGNLSMRVDGAGVFVTPSGCDKARLSARSVILMRDGDGPAPSNASSELRLHLEIYRTNPEIRAVVHAHPPRVQELAALGRVPDCALLLEAELLIGCVCRVAGLPPGSRELAGAVARGLEGGTVCVMERHGAITAASTMDMAVLRMLLLERLAGLSLAVIRA
jgi:L-fuculose-phosphate aldolase